MDIDPGFRLRRGPRLLLQATMVLMILLGAVMILAPMLGEKVFYLVYYQSFSPPADFSDEARRYIRFTNAVLGAVMIGWMTLTLWLVNARQGLPFPLRSALLLSFGSWFVVDTTFSAVHGVWGNVVLNALVAIGTLAPLQFGARAPSTE